MKRLIALIISIAMVASLATGLAVTSFADEPVLEINDNKWPEVSEPSGLDVSYVEGTYTIRVTGAPEALNQICTYNANLVINIPSGKTLKINNTNLGMAPPKKINAIYIENGNLTITGEGMLEVTANNSIGVAIKAGKDIIITGVDVVAHGNQYGIFAQNGNITITGGTVEAIGSDMGGGICAGNTLNISSNNVVKAKAQTAFSGKGITVNGASITDITLTNQYFSCDNGGELVYSSITNIDIKSSPTDKWVYVKQNGNLGLEEDLGTEENDPEVEIDFGFGPVTVKTSNKSLVLNDKKIVETEVLQSENLFVPFDLSNTPVKLDGLFLNNDVYQYISGVGKGIELETRFAKADVFKKDNIGQNPLSLHLSDVSEVAGTCATAIQKKAMNTNKVYAQVNYSFVSNGQPVENDAKIYVPVDGEAKVFFIINENTLGSIPCETRNGYCVFNRYMDGTYVICAK